MTEVPAPESAVVIERTLDEPVTLVWSMWTDPAHFGAWYGPPGASVTVAERDAGSTAVA